MSGGLAKNHVMKCVRHSPKNRQKPRHCQNQKQRQSANQTAEQKFLLRKTFSAVNDQRRQRNEWNGQGNRSLGQKTERDGHPTGQMPLKECLNSEVSEEF